MISNGLIPKINYKGSENPMLVYVQGISKLQNLKNKHQEFRICKGINPIFSIAVSLRFVSPLALLQYWSQLLELLY